MDTEYRLVPSFCPTIGGCAWGTYISPRPDTVLQQLIVKTNPDSTEMYGQIYNPHVFEPRRLIEQPEGVGDLTEGHPSFGFGRR